MVDFVEAQHKRERGECHNHSDVDLLGLKQLLYVAAIALAALRARELETNIGLAVYVSRTGF